jgi:hypothetical protein
MAATCALIAQGKAGGGPSGGISGSSLLPTQQHLARMAFRHVEWQCGRLVASPAQLTVETARLLQTEVTCEQRLRCNAQHAGVRHWAVPHCIGGGCRDAIDAAGMHGAGCNSSGNSSWRQRW